MTHSRNVYRRFVARPDGSPCRMKARAIERWCSTPTTPTSRRSAFSTTACRTSSRSSARRPGDLSPLCPGCAHRLRTGACSLHGSRSITLIWFHAAGPCATLFQQRHSTDIHSALHNHHASHRPDGPGITAGRQRRGRGAVLVPAVPLQDALGWRVGAAHSYVFPSARV